MHVREHESDIRCQQTGSPVVGETAAAGRTNEGLRDHQLPGMKGSRVYRSFASSFRCMCGSLCVYVCGISLRDLALISVSFSAA